MKLLVKIKDKIEQLLTKSMLLDLTYPVGSIYWTSLGPDEGGDPALLFGGIWTRIKDKFILAAGDEYKANEVGGNKGGRVTIENINMPKHSHSYTPSGTIKMNAHSHGVNNHSHSFNWSGSHRHNLVMAPSAENENGGTNSVTSGIYAWAGGVTFNSSLNYAADTTITVSGDTGGSSPDTTSVTSTGTFTGVSSETGEVGASSPLSIMPPYETKYCWQRIE